MSPDTIIVGAGIFGQITAKALRAAGQEVLVVDKPRKGTGSRPAACLIKPSWVAGLGASVVDASLGVLDELYDLQTLKFRVGPLLTDVHWIDPATIMAPEHFEADVLSVEQGVVRTTKGDLTAPNIVVAAGVWTNDILPEEWKVPGLAGRAGVAYTWEGQIEEPFIKPWAPYRQVVAFNRGPNEVWAGDGSAIVAANWTPGHDQAVLDRCQKALGHDRPHLKRWFGLRPYVPKVKPCYLESPERGVFVATGGAKNGTLAAGWCAGQIVAALS